MKQNKTLKRKQPILFYTEKEIQIMYCSCTRFFSVGGRATLVQIPSYFNQTACMKIIEAHLLLFMNEAHAGNSQLVLQEDNCGPQCNKFIAT